MEIMNNLIYKLMGTNGGTMKVNGKQKVYIVAEEDDFRNQESVNNANAIKEKTIGAIAKKFYMTYRKGYETPIQLEKGMTEETLDALIKDNFYEEGKVDENQTEIITRFTFPTTTTATVVTSTVKNNPFIQAQDQQEKYWEERRVPQVYAQGSDVIVENNVKWNIEEDYMVNQPTIDELNDQPIKKPTQQQKRRRAHSFELQRNLKKDNFIVSDAGWGCMLRSGQMMMAEIWRILYLRDAYSRAKECSLLRMFLDKPEKPYSIHQMAMRGELLFGKKIGNWFGPAEVAEVMQHISKPEKTGFATYVASSSTIVKDDLRKAFGTKNKPFSIPLLLLIPTMLGLDQVHKNYKLDMRRLMAYKDCMGFIGGKPNQAMYFVGMQGENFFALDPHRVQLAAESRVDTFHCKKPRQLQLNQLDPCLTFSFLFHNEMALNDFLAWMIHHGISGGTKPLFAVREKPIDMDNISLDDFAL